MIHRVEWTSNLARCGGATWVVVALSDLAELRATGVYIWNRRLAHDAQIEIHIHADITTRSRTSTQEKNQEVLL